MKCMIVAALFVAAAAASAVAPLDTPEVAAAKAAHFAEYNRAAAAAGAPGNYYGAYPYSYGAYPYSYGASPYSYGAYPYAHAAYPYAAAVVKPDGFLADTPEVSAAKAAHFAEHAKAGGSAHYAAYPYSYGAYPYSYGAYPYSYGYAGPIVTPQGFIADTPEVAAAKAAHFAEHAKASHH